MARLTAPSASGVVRTAGRAAIVVALTTAGAGVASPKAAGRGVAGRGWGAAATGLGLGRATGAAATGRGAGASPLSFSCRPISTWLGSSPWLIATSRFIERP